MAGQLRTGTARVPALAALALPVLAGAAFMAVGGAPSGYAAANLAALVTAGLWVMFGRQPRSIFLVRSLAIVLVAMLFFPLVTGPQLNGIARWVPIGAFNIHAGMLCVPALRVLTSRDQAYAAPLLLTALLAALLQPDAATGLALVFGAAGLHHVTRDWRVGVAAIAGFVATLVMATRGELPAQPFVERVLVDALSANLPLALMMAAALLAGFLLILFAAPLARPARFACAGSLAGFVVMSIVSNYPTPLAGFGVSAILGYGFALGLVKRDIR